MKTTRSEKLFKEACELIPGGVNSPVRACLGVGADPLFIASAKGSHVTTVDGQEMIDFVESWGPMLLGHSHPEVTKAVVEAAGKGTSYGAPCPAEVELARMVVDAHGDIRCAHGDVRRRTATDCPPVRRRRSGPVGRTGTGPTERYG